MGAVCKRSTHQKGPSLLKINLSIAYLSRSTPGALPRPGRTTGEAFSPKTRQRVEQAERKGTAAGKQIMERVRRRDQTDVLTGDIALNADASHVGMVVGRTENGEILVCHCSSGQNNVAVTEFEVSEFTVIGRLL